MDAKQVPLRELLASVPADARLLIDDADGLGSRSIPVGRLCQEAAAALAEPVQEPLTIERLRDALVASRIIPPAAVEDPDEYDDGITLFRIEALHRRIT